MPHVGVGHCSIYGNARQFVVHLCVWRMVRFDLFPRFGESMRSPKIVVTLKPQAVMSCRAACEHIPLEAII